MQNAPVAVLSDIHGNRWALEAVLDDIRRRGIRDMFNLGDSLYGPRHSSRPTWEWSTASLSLKYSSSA
jgi:predicted phosphodiesterase